MRSSPFGARADRLSASPPFGVEVGHFIRQLRGAPFKRVRIEDDQAASRPVVGVSREAAASTGVAVIRIERAASCRASS